MNKEKIKGAVDIIHLTVSKTSTTAPSMLLDNNKYYKEFGKQTYAQEILPLIDVLKSYLNEDDKK